MAQINYMCTVLPFIASIKMSVCYYLLSHLTKTKGNVLIKKLLCTAVMFDRNLPCIICMLFKRQEFYCII